MNTPTVTQILHPGGQFPNILGIIKLLSRLLVRHLYRPLLPGEFRAAAGEENGGQQGDPH